MAPKEISVPRTEICSHCHGNQAEPGTPVQPAQIVTAADRCVMYSRLPWPVHQHQDLQPLPGEGKTFDTPCSVCHGSGTESRMTTVSVTIPAGIDNGQSLRLRGRGEAGQRGGPPGDLLILVRIKPHDVFRREGRNVVVEVPISLVQASVGDEIKVPTLEGSVNLRIPEGTQSGRIFRLRNKGIRDVRGPGRAINL